VKRRKMNTKIIVALVLGIALIGLTGAASAGYYYIDGSYVYADTGTNTVDANSNLNVQLTGTTVGGDYLFMHNWIRNSMNVNTLGASPTSDVNFAIAQGGESTLTVETNLPGNMNTFSARDVAFQNADYKVNGDAYDITFRGSSTTHASVHENATGSSILPIGQLALWDSNRAATRTSVNTDKSGNPMATIKSGNMGYVCYGEADVLMESDNIYTLPTIASGITVWSNAEGEALEPYGRITNEVQGSQHAYLWWP
jgi:hypothetical protein